MIRCFDSNDIQNVKRLSEMTGRTNQFNIFKNILTEDEIRGNIYENNNEG